ncbi:MAG: MMPL family transporter [Planctomycetia bacterium]|nr:MMPL family transporter [Planctomycetia bacterium]
MKKTFYEKYALLILVMMMFTLPIMALGVKRTLENVRNNIKEWLPEGTTESALHTWFQQNFPNEQFILMSWDGCTLNDPRLDVMKHRILPRKDKNGEVILEDYNLRYYETYTSGRDFAKQLEEGNGIPFKEAVGRLKGSLIGMDEKSTAAMIYLRPGCEGENLKGPIGELYRLARKEFVFDRRKLTKDQISAVEEIQAELSKSEVKKEPKNFLERKLSLAMPENPTEDELNRSAIPEEDLIVLPGLQPSQMHMGGPPVDNVAIDVEGNRTLMRLAWLAALVGLTMATLCLRSFRLVAIVFFAALFATGYALAVVNFTGSSTDAIMLSMPPLVYVLTMSSAIHFINYYHDALEEEGGIHGAVERAVQHAFMPVTIAATTTALGLFSLLTSTLGPIYNFGLYSGIGVIISVAIIFLYVPAILQLFPSHRFSEKMAKNSLAGEEVLRKDVIGGQWQKLGHFIIYHPLLVCFICSCIMGFGFAGLPQLQPSVKLMNFFKQDTTIIHDYTWLEENLGPLVPMEVVVRFDNEKIEENLKGRLMLIDQIIQAIDKDLVDHAIGTPDAKPVYVKRKLFFNRPKKSLADDQQVGGVLSVATLLPDPTAGSLAERAGWNGQVIRNYPQLREYMKQDLLAAERKFSTQNTAEGDQKASPTLAELGIEGELEQKLRTQGITTLAELRAQVLALEKTEKSSPNSTKQLVSDEEMETLLEAIYRWQVNHCDELFRITCRVKALTDVDYGYFVDELRKVIDPVIEKWLTEHNLNEPGEKPAVEAIYTGSVPLVYKTQHDLMSNLFWSVLLSFVTISAVIMLMFRSIFGGFLAMIPNIFPLAVVFGMMGWLGVLCDLGAMMTASVALGIATDDTIHYLTWYRRALAEGLEHREAALSAYRRCATAMTQTTVVAAFGLSVFAFSTFTPTLYFGIMMLVLMFMALFGDLIYLPSILILSGGKTFAKGNKPLNDEKAGTSQVAESQKAPEISTDSVTSDVSEMSIISDTPGIAE